jgi:amidase
MTQTDWRNRAETYKASVLSSIPTAWRLPSSFKATTDVRHAAEVSGILTPAEVKLLARDATTLAADIASGKFSAVEVATAYCKSAAVAHQTTNCLMDFFPEEALARAKELDEILQRTGVPVGPMHGVPLSIKGKWNSIRSTLRPFGPR